MGLWNVLVHWLSGESPQKMEWCEDGTQSSKVLAMQLLLVRSCCRPSSSHCLGDAHR